jgi:hypothetical protein
MTIDLACPGCGKSYSLPASQAGKRARCKRCGLEFRIELAADEPSPPAKPQPALRPANKVVVHPSSSRPETIPVACPSCGFHYEVDASLGGKRGRCKTCREIFRLPEVAAAVPTPDAPAARVTPARVEAPARPSLSLPPGGLGPLRVGLVAVGACLAVVGIGVMIRAITHGLAGEAEPDAARPRVAKPGGVNPGPPRPPAVAARFEPFPDEPPAGERVRDDVLIPHRSYYRRLADAAEALVPLFRTMDGPPDPATLARKKSLEARIAQVDAGRAALPSTNAAEEYRLLVEFAGRLIDIGDRQKAEIRRVLSTLPDGAFAAELRQQMARTDQAAAAFRKGLGRGPGAVPCVDVLLPDFVDPDGLAGEAIRARLETMTDAGPPEVFKFRSVETGRAGFGVRLGPVADPQAFARKVNFGTPSVQGRRISVVDVHADPADLAEARAGRAVP